MIIWSHFNEFTASEAELFFLQGKIQDVNRVKQPQPANFLWIEHLAGQLVCFFVH